MAETIGKQGWKGGVGFQCLLRNYLLVDKQGWDGNSLSQLNSRKGRGILQLNSREGRRILLTKKQGGEENFLS